MDEEMDALILSSATDRWQKVAKIIALVSDRAAYGTKFEAVAGRINTLVAQGKLDAKGDPSRWRYSEVRRAR